MNLNFHREVLPNGLRVLTLPMKETKAVTILFLVGAGSRYETQEQNGVAHFLEHMFFKGTKHRPSTLEISKQLDALGADYNAYTGEDLTGFYVRVAADDFRQAFDIISDMLLFPLFKPEEIEREKGVIVEEINMYEDTPMRTVHDQAKRFMFGDTPLGRNIAGTKERVTSFQKADFLAFRKAFYQPNNMIVAIAGAGDPTSWKSELATRFGSLPGSADPAFEPAKFQTSKARVKLIKKKTDQAHLVLAFPGFKRTDPRRPILITLMNILGGTMSSRLFIEVRERRGLAYYVRGGQWFFRDCGAFVASAGVKVPEAAQAIQVIREEFMKLAAAPVLAEELERAKKNFRGSMYLGMEDSMNLAEFLANQELYEDAIKQPEEIVQRIEQVTAREIHTLAKEFFDPRQAYLTLIGPYTSPQPFEQALLG